MTTLTHSMSPRLLHRLHQPQKAKSMTDDGMVGNNNNGADMACIHRTNVEPVANATKKNNDNDIACAANISNESMADASANISDLTNIAADIPCTAHASNDSMAENGMNKINASGINNKELRDQIQLYSNFDPFRRMKNIPFALVGSRRQRSQSLGIARRPSLSTIFEDIAEQNENDRID